MAIDETLAVGEPLHVEHHIALAQAVNRMYPEFTLVQNTVATPSTANGFTSSTGTWTTSGGYTVNTSSGADDALTLTAAVSSAEVDGVAAQVTVNFDAAAGTSAKAGFRLPGVNTSAYSTGDVSVWLRRDGNIEYDRYGTGGSTLSLGTGTLAVSTDFVLGVVFFSGKHSVWLDGVYKGAFFASNPTSGRYVGLSSRSTANNKFKDFRAWRVSQADAPKPW